MAATSIQTCYRHSDRRAGVRCQRCDRPICPSCMHQASVGFHCPECARAGRQKVYSASSLTTRPIVTFVIVALNAVVFIADLASGASGFARLNELGWDGALLGHAIEPTNAGPVEVGVAAGEWWRIVTSGFLHANLLHIGMNMFLLWQLGLLLEPAMTRISFITLFTMSLLGGSFLTLVLDPETPAVGASGAVFGLMGAAFVGLRARGIDPFSTSIGPLIVLNLIITFLVPGISVGGHVGGLVAGALGGWLLLDAAPQIPNGRLVTPAICAVVSGALFAGSIYVAYNPI